MKILVIGGTVGLRLSVSLYSAGYDVLLVGGRKITGCNSTITMNGKKFVIPPIQRNYPQCKHYDVIFVATKLFDTKACIQQLHANAITYDLIAIIQNGLVSKGFYDSIETHTFVSLSIVEGIQFDKSTNTINTISSDYGRQIPSNTKGETIASLLSKSNIPHSLSIDIENTRIRKMIMNCTLNGMSAIFKTNVSGLIDNHNKNLVSIFNETHAALSQEFKLLDKQSYQVSLRDAFEKIRPHFTTMYQDTIQKRKTEIDYLNGYIIKLGQKYGIPTPINQRVYILK